MEGSRTTSSFYRSNNPGKQAQRGSYHSLPNQTTDGGLEIRLRRFHNPGGIFANSDCY